MAMGRAATIVITGVLFVSIVLVSVPARAQAPAGCPAPGGAVSVQSFACDLAALTARVAKLEGNITSADLVGTYSLVGIQTRLGGSPDVKIGSVALTGTLTLNAYGSGSLQLKIDGTILHGWSSPLRLTTRKKVRFAL